MRHLRENRILLLGIAARGEASLEGEGHQHYGGNQRMVLWQPIRFENAPNS